MQKGNTLIFLLVGILILAGVAGGAFYLGRQTTPKPSPTPIIVSQTPQPTIISSPSPLPKTFATDLLLELHEPGKTIKLPVDTYKRGQKIEVKLLNRSNISYVYNPDYQACSFTYTDSSRRKFIIPPGTHCDLISYTEIKPNETKTLFEWSLDECTQDNWGCANSQPLPAGTYTIIGKFYTEDPAKIDFIKGIIMKDNVPFTVVEKPLEVVE